MKFFSQIAIILGIQFLISSTANAGAIKSAVQDVENAAKDAYDDVTNFVKDPFQDAENGIKEVYDYFEKSSEDSDPRSTSCKITNTVANLFRTTSSDVNYLLFTPNNPHDACDLQPNVEALHNCSFNPNVRTIVLVHGWIERMTKSNLNFDVKDKLLETGNYNVVVQNWTYYTESQTLLSYPVDSLLTFYIGLRTSAWITFLQNNTGAKPEMFHLNGHSLGAHVVSTAGKATCNLGGITFMDAAGPLFRFLPEFLNPTYTDAIRTQAIHTSGAFIVTEGYGLDEPYANIDYFPNGGSQQPQCFHGAGFRSTQNEPEKVNSQLSKISCNHDSVYEYYLASFNKDCRFLGLICDNYKDYESGKCNSGNSIECEMNFDLEYPPNLPPKSKCYLNTLNHYPYCMN